MKFTIILISFICIINNLHSNEIWKKVYPINKSETSIRIKCADSINCVHLTNHEGFSKIYKSNDGGYTWSLIVDNHLKDFTQIHNIDYPERNHIFTTCNDQLLNINFIIHFDGDGKPLDTTFIDVTTVNPNVEIRGRDIRMHNTNTGIVNIGPYLIYTNDGWQTYKILISDIFFTRVTIQDENCFGAYTVSNDHRYIFTENGGITFDTIKTGFPISDIFFLNSQVGYLKGSKRLNPGVLPSEWGEVLLKTTDGGRNWVTILDTIIDKYNTSGNNIFMISENKGSFVSKNAVVIETDDGYKSFRSVILPNPGDKPDNTAWTSLTYSGNRPIVGASIWGIFTRVDTVYMKLIPPNLLSPPDKSEKQNLQLNFQWQINESTNRYVFQIAKDEKFESIFRSDTLTSGQLQGTMSHYINLPDNCTDYFWRVASYKSNTSKWSQTFTLRTKLDQVSLKTPFNQAKEISIDTVFYWNKLNNAERYHLQIAINNGDNKTFDDLIFSQDTLTITEHRMTNLPEGTDLIWHVRGYCYDGYGDWSSTYRLRTKLNTSVSDNNFISKILLTPNPAGDYITISIPELNKGLQPLIQKVLIFNILGVEVISTPASPGEENLRIDVSHLPAGVYYVRIGSMIEIFVKM
ncbi:hypothetical protein MASR1M45_19390 [Candidatus Kapaibacterium sp.]